jgi:hypothetical protein
VLFEVASRLILPEQIAALKKHNIGGDRVVFNSDAAYVDREGFFAYRPNSELREIGFYPDGAGGMTIEYDCRFTSDALGFVSNAVPYEKSDILLLGDSFAQGQGGCPWIPNLPAELRTRIYLTATQGHGFFHWQNIITFLDRIKPPRKLLILFITDDFYRPVTLMGRAQTDCLDGKIECGNQHYIHPIAEDMPQRALARHQGRQGIAWPTSDPKKLTRILFPATIELVRGFLVRRSQLTDSLRLLDEFTHRFDVRLVWLSTREEDHGREPRRHAVEEALVSRKLAIMQCQIPPEGYLPRDGHPNGLGNERIVQCVVEATRNWR